MLLAVLFSLPAHNPAVRLILYAHITAGTLALLAGLVPMLGRKGGPLHVRAGRVYVYSMLVVAAAALLLCLLQPLTTARLLLTGVAIFSFYLSFSGWRAAARRSAALPVGDLVLAAFVGALGLGLVGAALWWQAVLFGFFGVLLCAFAGFDLWHGLHPATPVPGPLSWMLRHLTRMGGSYISAVTALIVVNLGHWLPASAPAWLSLAGWIAPAVVGRVLIAAAVRRYKAQLAPRLRA